MTKEELRKIYVQKRSSLSKSEYLRLNKELFRVFFSKADLSATKILHSFLPIERNNEPDTRAIINHIAETRHDIRLVVPRVNKNTQSLEGIFLEPSTVLNNSSWGIPEPQEGVMVDPQNIDTVLIPMVIFDRRGHRVGYGKGFYDKFLTTVRTDCKRIGICFFEPVDEIENIMEFDQPLHQCITPAGSYTF